MVITYFLSEGFFFLSLPIFRLQGNHIGPAGAKILADALKVNSSLQYCSLDFNDIGPTGARFIADALRANEHIHTVRIGGNAFGDAGAGEIYNVLDRKRQLDEIADIISRVPGLHEMTHQQMLVLANV